MMFCNLLLLTLSLLLLSKDTLASRLLSATSLVTCMDNSQISPTYFDVTFDPDNRALEYNLDLTTEIAGNVIAHVEVFAYGFLIIEKDIDVCSLGWKQFCPLYPGSMQIESIEYISEKYAKQIPGIAFTVPDIDAIVKLNVYDSTTGKLLSCLQSSFSNGKTVAQTGAKWATAIIAGLGLLIAAILSTFGNSNAASHISANAVSLFLYFQAVVVVSMQHVERVPPIASSWAENLAWSMGLIRVEFMQSIFRWYVQATGGTPTTYFLQTTRQILVQRGLEFVNSLSSYLYDDDDSLLDKRASLDLNSNENLIVLRGIERVGYNAHIEPTSIVATGYTFFLLFGFLLVVAIILVKQGLDLAIRLGKVRPNKMNYFRFAYKDILKGSLLRYIYIGFTQLVILSLWEFIEHDSPALIVLAVLFLVFSLSLIGYTFWKMYSYGKESIKTYNNPAALLYGDSKILNKYGFCYTMFHADKYWFGIVLISYNLLKSIFIGLCQGSGKASVVVIFILDLVYTIYLIIQAPYLNKATNIVNYLISVVNTINSFLFLFFSDLFGQPESVGSIMGWIFFILNAAFSLILLILIIILVALGVISKNPDARFAPAKDDRTSFQRKSSIKRPRQNNDKQNNELMALGAAAQDHTFNWESEIQNMKNISEKNSESSHMLTPNLNKNEKFESGEFKVEEDIDISASIEESQNDSLGSKLKTIISRKLSKKERNDNKSSIEDSNNTLTKNKVSRISDTLNLDNESNNEEEDDDFPRINNFPKVDSKTPINQHSRNESSFSTSQASNYSSAIPANKTDII